MSQGSTQNQPHPPSPRPASDLDVPWVLVAGFVGAIAIFVFIIAIQILFQRAEQAQFYQNVVSEVPVELAQLRAQQQERINTYRLVDEKRQIAAIPVEQAMQIISRDPAVLATVAQSQPAGQTQPTATASTPVGGGQPR